MCTTISCGTEEGSQGLGHAGVLYPRNHSHSREANSNTHLIKSFVCAGTSTPWSTYGGQMFSSSTLWVPRIKVMPAKERLSLLPSSRPFMVDI